MRLKGKNVLLCNCERTMPLDAKAVADACGATASANANSQLCRAELEKFRTAARTGEELVVACTQEAPLFRQILEEDGVASPATFVNIRERAGWSAEAAATTAKIAALLAEATLDVPPAPTVTLKSDGVCLVYGRDEMAVDAARQLAGRLDVTLLLTGAAEISPPAVTEVPVFRGTIVSARGHFGAFEIVVNDYAPSSVSSRDALRFEAPRDGAGSRCDLILDLTGDPPLFPAHHKRDGYIRPDPGNPAAVQRALFDLSDLVGEFEKPRYVDFQADLCAHSRSRIVGCTRCLDVCPASAIAPDGDTVAIDPHLCGGCGGCNSVCPTGAADYRMPPNATLLERVGMLLSTFLAAGGGSPALLLHDSGWGQEMIDLMARHGRGLPADVLPFAVNEVTQVGFDFLVGALAKGATQVVILAPPTRREELSGLAGQVTMADITMTGLGYGDGRINLVIESDPEAVERQLYALPEFDSHEASGFLPLGGKRTLIRLALDHLHHTAPQPTNFVFLPPEAPFGGVKVDVDGCTLCLACVGACPTGALRDNPEQPQLRFQEDACIQCGLCKNTCPEKVISLEPRLNFTAEVRQALIVKEEEPFNCVRCGKPFGTRGSIERIVEQLANKHAMFRDPAAVDRLKMCQDCRVIAQFEQQDDPFAGGDRPPPRTTDDYLRERAEIEAARAQHRTGRASTEEDEPDE